MSALHALFEGDRFGAYRVLSRLASGGMADVWFVEATNDGSRGVLKTMRPELSTSSELRAMFLDEGRVAADLQHENIAKVLEVGVLDGQPYIAMEFVHGRTLRQIAQHCLAEQRRIETWFVLRTLIDVCSALEYLHSYADAEGWHLGLAHGDISPENIMVGFNGTVKLLDFGVSRAARHAERTRPRPLPDDSMVAPANDQRAGLLFGKPWYMAPEQIQGSSINHLSDLYSLGVVLYECLTGYRPYAGTTQAEVLARVLEAKPPPPQEIARGISEPLAWTTLRAMARDPDHRFSSAGDFAAALRARLREVDPSGGIVGGRSLDGYMAALFGEPDTLASAVMRTISERTRHSDFPTAPCSPAVVAAALAKAAPSAPPPRARDRKSAVERSGSFPAQTALPDIFGQSTKGREHAPSSPPPFGRRGDESPGEGLGVAMGARQRTDGEQEAAHLFEQGLALLAAKDFDGARDAWQRAAELDPREKRYRINLRKLQERS